MAMRFNLVRLLSVAVLALGLFVLWSSLPSNRGDTPAPRRSDARSGDEDNRSARCVTTAQRANDTMLEQTREFVGSPGSANWDGTAASLTRTLGDAARTCLCPEPACDTAAEAIVEMQALLAELNAAARGTATNFPNPAVRQERINQLLNEAQGLLDREP